MFPYIVLTIFFVTGITLEGAPEGLAHMFRPKVGIHHCFNILKVFINACFAVGNVN